MEKIKEDLHADILNLRNIETLINSASFDLLCKSSSEEQLKAIKSIIKQRDRTALDTWVKDHPTHELGEMSVRRLRELASKKRVPNYSRLDKLGLLQALQKEPENKVVQTIDVDQMIDTIKILVNDMLQFFPDMKLPTEDYLLPEISSLNESLILEGYAWVTNVHNTKYRSVSDIKELLPDDVWKRYKAWGSDFGEHREVLLLNKALTKLRKTLISAKRPILFKRSKLNVRLEKIKCTSTS